MNNILIIFSLHLIVKYYETFLNHLNLYGILNARLKSYIGGGSVHDVAGSYLLLKSNNTGAHYEFVYKRKT